MSDGAAILLTIAGTTAGVLATWYYDRKSSSNFRHLAGDVQKTHQAVIAIGRIVEQNGQGKFSRDEAGNITGIVLTASARDVISFSDRADAVVVRGQPPQYDRQHEQPPSPEPEGGHA